MEHTVIELWERDFRAAAKSDGLRALCEHLRLLGLPEAPDRLLSGTIRVVQACNAYDALDHNDRGIFNDFLQMQQYRPEMTDEPRYTVTFDLCGREYARIVVQSKFVPLDLADLYNHPWWDLKMAGYTRFWIMPCDRRELSQEEIDHFEEHVTYDLRFDYAEDEVEFFFETEEDMAYLKVDLHEVAPEDRDHEAEQP